MSMFSPKIPNTTAAPAPNSPEAKADPIRQVKPTDDRNKLRAKAEGRGALRVDLNSGTTFSDGGSARAGGSAGINLPRL